MAQSSKSLTTGEIASALGLDIRGDENIRITRIASLKNAVAGCISFVVDKNKLDLVRDCSASALIVPTDLADGLIPSSISTLESDNPYLSYAKLTQLWAQQGNRDGQTHPSAIIDPKAHVAKSACIGAGAMISADAVIAEQVVVDAGAFVGAGVQIGKGTTLHANTTVRSDCIIGEDCEIHSGAVIGADGFGFAPGKSGWEKICQLGRVVIGNKVSVGACTSIDRGALDDTILADGVILDNQIQVAHNVVIGKNTAIAGCTGIAGSTVIGENCRIGGAVSIVGHITICDNVLITANTFVTRSIKKRGSYSSGIPLQDSSSWRKNAVRLRNLDTQSRELEKLARDVDNLTRSLKQTKIP